MRGAENPTMARNNRNHAPHRKPRSPTMVGRKATVVHDGSAFELAADLRNFGFEVTEGPPLSFSTGHREPGELAVLATRAGGARPERLHSWTREICGQGATLLAVGSSVAPVAQFFGSADLDTPAFQPTGRLAAVTAAEGGLFSGVSKEFRLALPAGDRVDCENLNAEFGVTAWAKDGELIGASHVFRPVHLLHAGALESRGLRSAILGNLLRLVRECRGRAF